MTSLGLEESSLPQPPRTLGADTDVQAYDPPSFLDAIARRYGRALNSYFGRRVRGRREDCEDMTQEVFVRLAKRGSSEEIRNVESYLFQVAAGVLADDARRRKVRHRSDSVTYCEEDHAIEDFSPERLLIGREQVERALAAIEALPQRTRHALVMFRFEEMKQAEIARRMGISVSAVEKHVKLGMIRVSEALGSAE